MAKKFNFRMDSLLRIRSHKVDMAKDELAKVVAFRHSKEQIKQSYLNEIELISSQKVKMSLDELRGNFHRKSFLKDEITKVESEIERIKELENVKIQQLQAAMREEKVLINLKDKKYQGYLQDMKAEENIMFDEISLTRFITNENRLTIG